MHIKTILYMEVLMKEKEKTKEEKTSLRPSPTALLNPRMDVNFKAIFTQETEESNEALKSFLSSVLGKEVVKVQISANEPPVDIPSQIQMTFDVSVTFNNGEKADIEMQGKDQKYDFSVRSEIQVARLLNNNAKKGSNWSAEKVYQISVLNFHPSNGDKSEIAWYTMKNKNGRPLAEYLNIIFLDLLEIKKLVGTPVSELTPVQKWGLFLSYADDEDQADYISKIAESEKGIMEVGRMSEEDSNWFRQFSIDTYRRDQNAIRDAITKESTEKGLKKGLQQGLKQGLQQGRFEQAIETAEALIRMNVLTADQIAQATNLSKEKIQELQKSIAEGKK